MKSIKKEIKNLSFAVFIIFLFCGKISAIIKNNLDINHKTHNGKIEHIKLPELKGRVIRIITIPNTTKIPQNNTLNNTIDYSEDEETSDDVLPLVPVVQKTPITAIIETPTNHPKHQNNLKNPSGVEPQVMVVKPDKNGVYLKWFIFVPLVILIFITTILSVAGFLVIVINSTTSITSITDKDYQYIHSLARVNYLARLKLRKALKKKCKKGYSNYRKEPENEGMVVKL